MEVEVFQSWGLEEKECPGSTQRPQLISGHLHALSSNTTQHKLWQLLLLWAILLSRLMNSAACRKTGYAKSLGLDLANELKIYGNVNN